MADPLSIAGSVVGITAAGVQASVKLYALAEKVATASQRVTSIADDISSTCAILNQVRELIIPQPDAQGTLKSVFNTVALNDISHALRRCRSSFTDINALLRRAFEQVGKRPALHSKIELSRFEKAKWPFLQPQFDELRNDLRDAKSNLVLMIAVASLALAQRDGRQRPVHDTERLELGSTIVQLQRASTVNTNPQNSSKSPRSEKQDSHGLFISGVDTDEIVSTKQAHMFEMANMTKALPPGPPALAEFSSPSSARARGMPLSGPDMSVASLSLASVGDTQVRAAEVSSTSHPPLEPSEPARISPPPRIGPWGRQARAQNRSLMQKSRLSDRPTPPEPRSSNPSFESTDSAQQHDELPHDTTATTNDEEVRYYIGWTTDHLEGLATGYGDSVERTEMVLPEKSLKALVKTYTDEGNDPHIAMSELTREQQRMIKESQMRLLEPELVYVRLKRNITVSSVFGTLNVETLNWVVTHTRRPAPLFWRRVGSPDAQSPSMTSRIEAIEERRRRKKASRMIEDIPMISSTTRSTSPSSTIEDLYEKRRQKKASRRIEDMQPIRSPTTQSSVSASKITGLYEKRKRKKASRSSEDMQPINPGLGGLIDPEQQDPSHSPPSPALSTPPASHEQVEYERRSTTYGPTPDEKGTLAALAGVGALAYGARRRASSISKVHHGPTITLADADDESDGEPDSVVDTSLSLNLWDNSIVYRGRQGYQSYDPEMTEMPSQPAEENGEDIVNELLARWTVS